MPNDNDAFAAALARDAEAGPQDFDDVHSQPQPEPEQRHPDDVVPEDSWLDPETFAAMPAPAKAAFRARLKAEKEQAAQIARRDAQIESLIQNQTASQAQASARPEKEDPFGQYEDKDLESWQAEAMRVQHAAAMNPGDDDIRDAAAKYTPERMLAIQKEMVRREARAIASEQTEPLRALADQNREFSLAQNRTRNYISETYGAQVLLNQEPDSPAVRAHQRVLQQKEQLGLGDSIDPKFEEALIRSAIDAEMAIESTRGAGSRDRAGLRRQELEGAYSRASAPSSARSAALTRGDSEAVYNHDLNALMDNMGI